MNRIVTAAVTASATIVAVLCAPGVLACGDKLTVLGGGIPFERIHTSHHRGSLVMYLTPDSRLFAVNNDSRLDQTLTRDGHQVKVVQTSAELNQALNSGQVDFVLVDLSQARQLQANLAASVPIVPVTYGEDAAERDLMRTRAGCVVESNKRHSQEIVREVEVLLENQATLATSCSGSLTTTSG